MALIEHFEARPIEPRRVHDGVVCGFAAIDLDGRRILQLETYGSTDRAVPGKVSQSIQLDVVAARKLVTIIQASFPEA